MDYRPNKIQFEALQSLKKMVAVFGGVGSGKTDCGSIFSLGEASDTPEGVISIICANSYGQLRDSTMRNLYRNWKRWGVAFQPQELPRSLGPFDLKVWNGDHWVEILARSLDHYELLSGVEIGWAWIDEAWGTSKAAVDLILARLRDPRMANQLLMTTIVDDPADSWMYDLFVDGYDEEIMDVFYMSTFENQKNLPLGYIEGLKKVYTKQMFKRMVLAEWISLSSAIIYYNFSRKQNVSEEAKFDPYLEILWSHDFNIAQNAPMSSILGHLKKGQGPDGKVRPQLDIFDEIVIPTSDTNDIIAEFKNREWHEKGLAGVLVTGDASGKAKDTRSKTTDYKILRDSGFWNQRVPTQNPAIRSRHNTVNTLLKDASGDVRIRVNPRCRNLIKALETTVLRKGADYLERESFAQHVGTSLGYLCCQQFPIKGYGVSSAQVTGF